MNNKQKIIVIGAGPAGLSFSYDILKKSKDYDVLILEKESFVGGISRTVNHNGNKIDIGGHRFFSKIKEVNELWEGLLNVGNPENKNDVLVVRNRLSRIFFLNKFFDYPISLSKETLLNLGIIRSIKIFFSYLKSVFFKIKKENSLEDFYINRFGRELYNTFFKDYTEKVWGVPCKEISKDWGGQRVKGLSMWKAIIDFFKKLFNIKSNKIETSLIDKFLYPKFGPGQMYEKMYNQILEMGGAVKFNTSIKNILVSDEKVYQIIDSNGVVIDCDYLISTMPIKDLINTVIDENKTEEVSNVASNLIYRDFITVGILLNEIKQKNKNGGKLKDNWIYIQEKNLKLGRLQIFNNWSEYMVSDKNKTWMGLEYFCNKDDEFWNMKNEEFKNLASTELKSIGFIDSVEDILDFIVIKQEKAYPAYFGSYNKFDTIKNYINNVQNLYCIGRNGMHKYNNMDHSILSGMMASDCIINKKDKKILWEINTENNYHEDKK